MTRLNDHEREWLAAIYAKRILDISEAPISDYQNWTHRLFALSETAKRIVEIIDYDNLNKDA